MRTVDRGVRTDILRSVVRSVLRLTYHYISLVGIEFVRMKRRFAALRGSACRKCRWSFVGEVDILPLDARNQCLVSDSTELYTCSHDMLLPCAYYLELP